MHINLTSDYAIRCLLILAGTGREMNSAEIAEEISVTRALTSNILRKLRIAGFVKSGRGVGGGYTLAKKPSEISLLDVLSVMEETMCISCCLDPEKGCGRHAEGTCPVRSFYVKLQEGLYQSLGGMTLEKLLHPDEDK